jgi:hypothetical protein
LRFALASEQMSGSAAFTERETQAGIAASLL